MVAWSAIGRSFLRTNEFTQLFKSATVQQISKNARNMSGHGPRLMPITPSRFQWHKFKDMVHFYVMAGLIPVSAIILYCNIFIGPATLTEISGDYQPKHWEYYRHPVTRFFARYIMNNPQQDYEKIMHVMFEENEKAQMRFLEKKVHEKMAERADYQAYYYRPAIGKYHRISKEAKEYTESILGD